VKKPYEVVVIQPNIDPYNEKFNSVSDEEQLVQIMSPADKLVTRNTQLVVAPETALYPNYRLNEEEIHQLTAFHLLMERRARWNNASFLIGATTAKTFDYPHSPAAHYDESTGLFTETYNASVLFKENRTPEIVHKSKLVLGVEKVPFTGLFPQLEALSISLEGSGGSLGIQDEGPTVMTSRGVNFAPVICYESVFGGFVSRQCRQDARFIAVITNDGWWDDTPGYKQHFAFSRLRAIENRKYVVRSANTGKSGIINQRGDVLKETPWWQKAAFRSTIQLNERKTLYEYLGDYIGYFAVAGFFVFLAMRIFKAVRR
jgi:apolipoprotein N-acyltransferase